MELKETEAEEQPLTWRKIYIKFCIEVLEALAIVTVIYMVTDKTFDVAKIIRIALVVACITTVLELYRPEAHSKVKDALLFSFGSSLIS
jgi:hypothetical protein